MKAQTGDFPLLYLSNVDFILPGLILSVLNSRKPLTTHGIQCRKFEGNLAEASASRSCGGGPGGLLFICLFVCLFVCLFLNLAEAAASAASMQFTALGI